MKSLHRREKSRLLACVLSFLLPGIGQLYLGRVTKGLFLSAAVLIDVIAIVQFAGYAGGRYLLLIVYLGIALPIIYFYGMYDVLQGSIVRSNSGIAQEPADAGTALTPIQGGGIMAVGVLLLFLLKPTENEQSWVQFAGNYGAGTGLILTAIILFWKRGSRMYRLGRITASVSIIAVGSVLLWDRIRGRNDIALLGDWWPVVFILLGLEIVAVTIGFRTKRLSFDTGGLLAAVIITVVAYSVSQYAGLPFKWIDQLKVDLGGTGVLTEEKGFQYTKESVSYEIADQTGKIEIDNPNGRVTVKQGTGNRLTAEAVVWVDLPDKAEADKVAEASVVDISGEEKLKIEAKGKLYGSNDKRKPRMNVVITLPKRDDPIEGVPPVGIAPDSSADTTNTTVQTDQNTLSSTGIRELSINAVNGAIDVAGLALPDGLTINNTDGEITVLDLAGSVKAETKNGGVKAVAVTGTAKLKTFNGDVIAKRVTDETVVSTSNGSIELQDMHGNVEADTDNGKISASEIMASLNADTLNGQIDVHSSEIGGPWDVGSSVGEIRLYVPEYGNYMVSGSVTFGTITTDLPLNVSEKVIRGEIGAGTYRINIDANNSITVNKYQS